ncbi:MAG TPA: hypothetical protein PKE63_09540 [Lacibacter sp.]|nr:hypothetical protein [Lacibacter sp.]HMO87585.1 hypothetical protein [Lacibacter sp.]HMP87508.1 hypothetical protein [Lacibacter sp.]
MTKRLLATLLLYWFTGAVFAQSKVLPRQRIRIFLDCSNTWCDQTFIRTEFTVVDFVVDRLAADVHVLVTAQPVGSGGEQYQLIFYGLNKYQQAKDTLRFETLPLATEAERRTALLQHMKAGLLPFIAKSGFLDEVTITTSLKTDSLTNKPAGNAATKDKWNYWVFRARTNGNFSADQNYRSRDLGGRLTAERITEELKVSFTLNGNDNRNIFRVGSTDIKVSNHSLNFGHQLARSINQHWTYGYDVNASQATFTNIKSSFYFNPGIEYNVFPYKSVNSKLLTIRYGPDIRLNNYYDTTIYGKTSEWLAGHNISVNLSLNQKWGTVSSGVSYRNFFNNWKFYNISFNTYLDVRLTGNLSFNVYAFPSIVRDQVFLPKGDASPDDILSRRRQLQTSYNFFMGFGVTYRFGSILNNFVNPRFNNNGGGVFFF